MRSGDGDLDDALHALADPGPSPTPQMHQPARPVLLVHGTNDTPATMNTLAAALRRAGREVVSLDYGRHRQSLRGQFGGGGLGPLRESTRDLLQRLDDRLAAMDAAADGGELPEGSAFRDESAPIVGQVDLVGHSQGGLHALACARARPGRVAHVVLLGAPLHGVRPIGAASRWAHAPGMRRTLDTLLGPSARQQVVGSEALVGGADPAPGARHLFVASADDWVLRNVDRQLLADRPGWRTVWTHDAIPGRRTGTRACRAIPTSSPSCSTNSRAETYRPTVSMIRSSCSGERSVIPRTWAQAGTMSGP